MKSEKNFSHSRTVGLCQLSTPSKEAAVILVAEQINVITNTFNNLSSTAGEAHIDPDISLQPHKGAHLEVRTETLLAYVEAVETVVVITHQDSVQHLENCVIHVAARGISQPYAAKQYMQCP